MSERESESAQDFGRYLQESVQHILHRVCIEINERCARSLVGVDHHSSLVRLHSLEQVYR